MLNQFYPIKSPWAVSRTTVQCQNCNSIFTAEMINSIDTSSERQGSSAFKFGISDRCISQKTGNFFLTVIPNDAMISEYAAW